MLEFVFSVEIPQHQHDVLVADRDTFLLHGHTNRGLIVIRKDIADESPHKTGLAYGKSAQHTDLLLDHGRTVSGPSVRASTEARIVTVR